MTTISQHLRKHLQESLGMHTNQDSMPSLEELQISEWSPVFEKLMRNRLILSSFRYGLISQVKAYDYVSSIRQRLELFDETGNAEHLVDIANICLVIFEKRLHPNFHFKAADDGIHAEVTNETIT